MRRWLGLAGARLRRPSSDAVGHRSSDFKTETPIADSERSPATWISRPRGQQGCAYHLHLPEASKRSRLPLVVMLHGCRQDAQSFAQGTRMNQLADEFRFAVLYPEQSQGANPLRCWNWFNASALSGGGDAGLIVHTIESVANRSSIDRSRLYVVGLSAGGSMARILAVTHSHLFAACATHSGLMYRAASSAMQALAAMRSGSPHSPSEVAIKTLRASRQATRFVPSLVVHGSADEVVNVVNAQQIVVQAKALAEAAGSKPLIASDEIRITGQGRDYLVRDYTRERHVLLRQAIVEGLAHAWSGGDARFPYNDAQGPDASRLIWDFLSLHKLAAQPESTRGWRRRQASEDIERM